MDPKYRFAINVLIILHLIYITYTENNKKSESYFQKRGATFSKDFYNPFSKNKTDEEKHNFFYLFIYLYLWFAVNMGWKINKQGRKVKRSVPLIKKGIEDEIAKALRDAERDEENQVINKFIANVESRIYANLSKQLVDNMFSADGATSGTAEIEGATIFWEKDTDLGEISIRITEADGTVTTLTVPVGDFGV